MTLNLRWLPLPLASILSWWTFHFPLTDFLCCKPYGFVVLKVCAIGYSTSEMATCFHRIRAPSTLRNELCPGTVIQSLFILLVCGDWETKMEKTAIYIYIVSANKLAGPRTLNPTLPSNESTSYIRNTTGKSQLYHKMNRPYSPRKHQRNTSSFSKNL